MAMPAASAGNLIPARPVAPFRNPSHNKKIGNEIPSAGFVSSATPHSAPYASQRNIERDSPKSIVTHNSSVPSSTESDVSQIHSNGSITPPGDIAQSHPANPATAVPPTRRPAKYNGTVAAAENTQFNKAAAKKEAYVNGPAARKIAASKLGYTGASHAVGPVGLRNTSPNPRPCTNAFAIFPASLSKGTVASTSCGIFRC